MKEIGQRDWLTAVLLSSLLGVLGADRFYLGHIWLGVLKLLTAGGGGVWAIIDSILIIGNKLPDVNGRPLYKKEPPKELVDSGQVSPKEWIVALMYSIFFGWMGVDRFYLGYKKLGFIKLILLILCIILPFVMVLLAVVQLGSASISHDDVMNLMVAIGVFIALIIVAVLIWWIVDVVFIAVNNVKDADGKRLWK